MIVRIDQYTLQYTDQLGATKIVKASNWGEFQPIYSTYAEQQKLETTNASNVNDYMTQVASWNDQVQRGLNPAPSAMPVKPLRKSISDQGVVQADAPFVPPLPDPLPMPKVIESSGSIKNDAAATTMPNDMFQSMVLDALASIETKLDTLAAKK